MKTPLRFVELHGPLFLAGKNFGLKLDEGKHKGIVLSYDTDRHWVTVEYLGNEAWVPLSNVSSMTPEGEPKKTATEKLVEAKTTPIIQKAMVGSAPHKVPSAQVETPQSHVHAGPGAGVTGQEKKKVTL